MKFKEIFQSLSFNPYEYEVFYNLTLSLRIFSIIALTCFNVVYLIIIHLSLKPFLLQNEYMTTNIIITYTAVILASLIIFMPILIESLRPFKKTLTGVAQFSLIILIFLIYQGWIAIDMSEIFSVLPKGKDFLIGIIGFILNALAFILYAHLMKLMSLENSKKETEIQFAKKIQSQLVPPITENEMTFQVFGITNTAFDIGGDFFDVVKKDGKKILAVGDSTGHDIAAGLLMAITKGAFRTLVDEDKSFEHMGKSLNKTIYENSDNKMFLTFSSGEFDMKRMKVRLLNAGHMPVLHFDSTSKQVKELNPNGIAFGLLRNSDYETIEVKFNRGDTFVFMTDGIDEMTNSLNEEYGFERIIKIIEKNAANYSPKQIYEMLIKDVKIFANFKSFVDDVTFLAIKIL